MGLDSEVSSLAPGQALQVYLLGQIEFGAALALQRRLAYEVSGDRSSACLLLCEHPPTLSIGREGSRRHIDQDAVEFRSGVWPIRWVNRGGGCILHVPGQLAIYPVFPLDHLQLGVHDFLMRIDKVLVNLLGNFGVAADPKPEVQCIAVRNRPIAHIGIAVRNWVSYFGAFININPDLELFRIVQADPRLVPRMTSLERERHGPLRTSLVREQAIELFAKMFAFDRIVLFTDHPMLGRKASRNAFATST
jgi:lipoyl(octanoyl) transferase